MNKHYRYVKVLSLLIYEHGLDDSLSFILPRKQRICKKNRYHWAKIKLASEHENNLRYFYGFVIQTTFFLENENKVGNFLEIIFIIILLM